MLPFTATVEPYAGESGTQGPAYGSITPIICMIQPVSALARIGAIHNKRPRAKMLTKPGINITPESRVICQGETYIVGEVLQQPAPGGGIHHLEVVLM